MRPFEPGWLGRNLDAASREVARWPKGKPNREYPNGYGCPAIEARESAAYAGSAALELLRRIEDLCLDDGSQLAADIIEMIHRRSIGRSPHC